FHSEGLTILSRLSGFGSKVYSHDGNNPVMTIANAVQIRIVFLRSGLMVGVFIWSSFQWPAQNPLRTAQSAPDSRRSEAANAQPGWRSCSPSHRKSGEPYCPHLPT